MSRPQVDVATWISLDGSLSVATSSFSVATNLPCKSLDQWSRLRSHVEHDLFSVPSVLMSRPPIDVAASLSSYSSSVCVATSDLGCDHIAVCMTTSYVSILCLDLMVMSRHGFLLFFLFLFFRLQPQFYVATNSQVTTSKWCRDFTFFCSALLQVATLFSGCDITSGP